VQGEVDATRFDIAARVDGRVGEIPVTRGENVAANAVLVRIDNPETVAKHEQALAAKIVADAQLANINAGTRSEVIAARKAALRPSRRVHRPCAMSYSRPGAFSLCSVNRRCISR
jgi:HlyD family secretion protein